MTCDLACLVEKILRHALSGYAIFLVIVGTVFNTFSIYLCKRTILRKNSTFKILSFLFFYNILSLYTWNVDIFLRIFVPLNVKNVTTINDHNKLESLNIFTCKFFTFVQYFSLQAIAWLLTYVSVNQVIKINFPTYRHVHQSRVCIVLSVLLFLVNSHIILFVGVYRDVDVNVRSNESNATWTMTVFECYETEFYNFYPTWDQVHTFIYCFIPFLIMIVCNLLLTKKILISARNFTSVSQASMKKKKTISVFILMHSLLFIVCSMPEKICYGYFYDSLSNSDYGNLVLVITDELTFTFFGLNFMFQLIVNKLYRKEFIRVLKLIFIVKK